ncbi:type IV secretory system conjugative DNA transfer family protein [Spirosoma sp. KNUC1025]|uniref:type IV secretory system conjugative DNA transfer family protein n=1 Tax=Spirosoma sp. KNUC1025 TaxID=2894082 RepID=UPI0038648275|nr:TraM recognition domain-containing protein [Spirosoma sp. KNUC1025]
MDQFNLDQPLIEFASRFGNAAFTIRHAVEGIMVCGGIGSGKSSGSGRLLALKYLTAGFGGLVLCTKPDEKEVWQEYCRQTGRADDLIVIEPGGENFFNFLEYESSRSSNQTTTDMLVQVLKTVIRAGQEQDAGASQDPFWENSTDSLIGSTIDLCRLAYGKVSVKDMYEIVQSIPKSLDDLQRENEADEVKPFRKAFEAAQNFVNAQVNLWQEQLTEEDLNRMQDKAVYEAAMLDALPDLRLLKMMDGFFFDTLIGLSSKTRSVIDMTFAGFLYRLLREPIYSLFCRYPSTVVPEFCLEGSIILINLPVKIYEKAGRDAQILFKYCWQRAMEKRDVRENPRPVFLFADECQYFLHEGDQLTQTTARSSRICTVYLTQNLHNLYAAMGGLKSEYRVKSFLGTLATKIFGANSDPETNRYASELIGDDYFLDESSSTTIAQNFSQTKGQSRKLERIVRPEEFQRLRTGGPLNNYRVEAYLYRQGDSLMNNGLNHVKLTFNQNYQP